MNRRQFLRVAGGAALLGGVGTVGRSVAHPGPFEPLGSVAIDGAKEAVVSADGQTAYVAATTGYAVVDVSTPDRPEVLADRRDLLSDREDGPLRGIYDVKLDGETLVVVGPANPLPGAPSGVLVVDVSDPASPTELDFYETDFPIHNCFAADGRVYLTANDGEGNPLVVLDIASGDELGRWSLVSEDDRWADVRTSLWAIHDVWVRDGVAYIAHWDAGTWIVDVSDPANPAVITAIEPGDPTALADRSRTGLIRAGRTPPGNHHYVATNDDATLLGIGVESWAYEIENEDDTTELVGGPSGVSLWDISTPSDPTKLSTIDPPQSPEPTYGGVWTTAHNFDFHDGRLYTSWYRGGVKRHDITDPSDPVELAWWRDPETASFWTAQYAFPFADEGVFVASSWGVGDEDGALYTFPDHTGEQRNPPTLVSETTTESLVQTATSTPTGTAGDTPTTTGESRTETPGFGLAVGATALGAAGLWYRTRGRD
ncbi:hypothetical protein ACFQJC_14260 [Haloferax namakaokahaiae]|uniref:LVIVD repeat-containing protein n=1 Tax=Haloferax namakaokahaiae TaxID=1748331 RepID=A0ABD5ZHV0_9EURY